MYIYVSNETPNISVFFDNLQVTHHPGPLLEETHYYPFGLTMAGISSKAAGSLENKKKYNGYEFNNDFDINIYESFFRSHDPQLGRFWQVDPKPTKWESPYASMGNNPINNFDTLGDTIIPTLSFIKDQRVMNGYSLLSSNNTWGKFAKKYGTGKYSKSVNIVATAEPNLPGSGLTTTYVVDKNGRKKELKTLLDYNNLVKENPNNANRFTAETSGRKSLLFSVNIAPGSAFTKDNDPALLAFRAVLAGETMIQEIQHVDIMHSDILNYGGIGNSTYQHELMRKDEYNKEYGRNFYQERYNYLMSNQGIIRNYLNSTNDNMSVEKFIKTTIVNAFDN